MKNLIVAIITILLINIIIQPMAFANTFIIPKGTELNVMINSRLTSEILYVDQPISAELVEDFVFNNELIAPEGSLINGTVINYEPAGVGVKSGEIVISFDSIYTPDGNIIKIDTDKVIIKAKRSRFVDILSIVGLNFISYSDTYAMIISSAYTVATKKGQEAVIDAGTVFNITLSEPVVEIQELQM